MGKEKVKKSEIEQNTIEIYYEIIGLLALVMAIVVWFEFGYIGYIAKIGLKIAFGNWSFFLIIYLFIIGIKAIFFRKLENIHDPKTRGIIFAFLSLILLSHSAVYEYASTLNSNPLYSTWDLYMIYLHELDPNQDLGGGMIGAVVYQALFFLLGGIGTTLVAIVFFIMGIIFITNNDLESIYYYVKIVIGRVRLYFITIKDRFKGIKVTKGKPLKKKRYGINTLSDSAETINNTIQKQIAQDTKNAIEAIFRIKSITYREITHDIGYTATRIVYQLGYLDRCMIEDIKKASNTKCIVNQRDDLVIIEYSNRFRELLTLKKILLQGGKRPLGIEIAGDVIDFESLKHQHMIISGDYNTGIRTFIKSFITGNRITVDDISYIIYDPKHEFIELKAYDEGFSYYDKDIEGILDKLSNEIEQRLALLKYLEADTLEEANKAIRIRGEDLNSLSQIVFLINGYENAIKESKVLDSKFIYLIQMGVKIGISLFIITRQGGIPKAVNSLVRTKMAFKAVNLTNSIEIVNNDEAVLIERKGDFILLHDDLRYRGQTGFISDREYMKIISSQ